MHATLIASTILVSLVLLGFLQSKHSIIWCSSCPSLTHSLTFLVIQSKHLYSLKTHIFLIFCITIKLKTLLESSFLRLSISNYFAAVFFTVLYKTVQYCKENFSLTFQRKLLLLQLNRHCSSIMVINKNKIEIDIAI